MRYKGRCSSPNTNNTPLRVLAKALTIIAIASTMMFLTTRPVAFGFQLPQKLTSFTRPSRNRVMLGLSPSSSSSLSSLSSLSHLSSPSAFQRCCASTLSKQKIKFHNQNYLESHGLSYSRRTILLHARRSTASSSRGGETSASPTVEVSPSDHGTVPLKSFDTTSNNSKIPALAIDDRLVKNLKQAIGANAKPTPIQAHAIPLLLDGQDIMASSPTGSGKSIMFGLPLLQKLVLSSRWRKNTGNNNGGIGAPRALVISPTRELAAQTSSVLKSLVGGKGISFNICLATGGADMKNQRRQLSSCDVLVGTPGRILQFSDERKLSLGSIDYLVVDEADRLLDMGFEPQLTRIARSLGRRREESLQQSILCSATFPQGVQRLAADFLRPEYYFVSVGRVGSTHANIRQRFEWVNTFYGNQRNRNNNNNNNNNHYNRNSDPKEDAVVRNVQRFWEETKGSKTEQPNVIVFTNTKDGAEQYGKALTKLSNRLNSKNNKSSGVVRVIHGDKPQSERNRAIQDFKSGKATTLVATDVAARGLDISTIGLVVQADTPKNIDTYTHRVGRTGRAGASGEAVTLIEPKSGFGIAASLVDLLRDADQGDSIPSWLQGMAHIANARSLEEEIAISAGTKAPLESSNEDIVTNEEFTGQDFRRTAVEGSYGAGRDTSYRSFDEEAYSSGSSDASVGSAFTVATDEETIVSSDTDEEVANDMNSGYQEDSIEESMDERDVDIVTSFQRQRPSRRLLDVIKESTGASEIGDMPDESLLESLSRKGGGNQKLRFEYLGMFPFDLVSPFLMSKSSSSNNDGEGEMPRVLMVAEKPSIAKAMAEALSGRRGPRQRRGISRALPVFEFVSDSFQPVNDANDGKPTKCIVTVTSVVGHIFSLGFDTKNQTQSQDPQDYFHLPVVKQEESTSSKLRVIDHLRALAGESDHLVLWLDCDPEGENIAHEVMAITRQAIDNNSEGENRIHRARFSAISPKALRDAFASLEEPDPALSRSVDARQELDLRIGVALTRLLTWRCVGIARKRFGPATRVVSYGPCQTPALSFCVDRAREIEEFEREPYSKVNIEVVIPNGNSSIGSRHPLSWKVPEKDVVLDMRSKRRKDGVQPTLDCASYNKIEAERIAQFASSSNSNLVVNNVRESTETIPPPLGLNTVALLEAGSKSMGMSPKQVMSVAEKLYSAGFISYPRTETTKYDPNGFDVRVSLREHASHPEWGRTASYLLRTKYSKTGKPPRRGKDVGDHPPITPLRAATREKVGGGAAWRVYEFVVRNFLGSLHNELSFTRRTASLSLPNNDNQSLGLESNPNFELEVVTVDSLGFTDCCRWVLRDIGASGKKDESVSLKQGDILPITKANLEEAFTKPPRFLQEHELILLMDSNGIGTDASMAVHVSNIVDRGYVMLCDETGQALRGPRRPGSKPLPRQIGRYMIPTALGMSLLDIFDRHDRMLRDANGEMEHESPALLSHPSIRRQMEDEVKQIAKGTFEKDYCLEKNLDWFEDRYMELEQSLDRKRVKEFGKTLTERKDDIRRWKALGAFEPKKDVPPHHAKQNQRHNKQNSKQNKQKNGRKTGKGSGGPPKGRRKNVAKKGKTQNKTRPKNNATKKNNRKVMT